VDALITAIFGSADAFRQQDTWILEFFTTENVKNMLLLWAKRWAQHVPIIHIPTFSILTAPDALMFILCVIGRAYSRTGIDPENLQWCVDTFHKLSMMSKVNGELDMPNLEAVYILVVLCTWHGNKQQRDMAKRLYCEVVDLARRYGYLQVPPATKTDGSDEAEWKSWIQQETRIR
jgi:Fungal specific transcription factor domain